MSDRLTLRQWWSFSLLVFVEKWFVVFGLFELSKLLLIVLLIHEIPLYAGWPYALISHSNPVLVLFGVPLALFLPLRDLAFNARVAVCPLSRARIARMTWCGKVLLMPAVLVGVPISATVFAGQEDLALMLSGVVAYFTLTTFLGACAWLLHPEARRYRVVLAPAILALWLCLPLDPARWVSLHYALAALLLILGLSSYAVAPALFARPERALLGDIPHNAYQRFRGYVQTRLDSHGAGFDLADQWPRLTFALSIFAIAVVMGASQDAYPVLLVLFYGALLLPLREPWPHDLSVIRTAPVDSRSFVRATVFRYLAAEGIVIFLFVPWLTFGGVWTMEHALFAAVVVGYGLLARALMWMTMPDRLVNHVMAVLLFFSAMTLAADIASGYWGEWFVRTTHVPLPMDSHELLFLLTMTSPLALVGGAWLLHRMMTRNMRFYRGRRMFGNLEFN